MKLPQLTPPQFTRRGAGAGRDALSAGIEPQDCGVLKAIGCATALAACAAVCVGTGLTGCAPCLAGLGTGSCIECL